jgi:hypothetical protein
VRDHLDVRLEPGAAQLLLQKPVHLVHARGVVHGDLDLDRPLLAVEDRDAVDRGRRKRVDRDLARCERDARASLRHVEGVGHAKHAGLERQRSARGAVARDHVQHLRNHHCQLGLVVRRLEELSPLARGKEEAEVLVVVAVYRHPRVVEERAEQHGDLRVVPREAVVGDERGLHAVLRELAEELQRDVGDDLDVYPGVVVDLEPRDGIDVRDVPERLQLRVLVHAIEDGP